MLGRIDAHQQWARLEFPSGMIINKNQTKINQNKILNKMGTIYNTDQSELIEKASEELKKIESIEAPDWALFVKTGMHKERPPMNNDWWYIRSAAVLRQVYRLGPIGVSKLRARYGGKKNRGVKREHFYKGSGSIARKILQQLEKEGFVKKDLKNVHKGRSITAKGKKFLDDVAATISKTQPNVKQREVKTKKEAKEKPVAKPKETTPKKDETPIEVPIKQ